MRARLAFQHLSLVVPIVIAACEKLPTERRAEGPALTAGQTHVGWIWDRSGRPLRVIYTIYKGHALWQGDIDLGLAHLIARTREELMTRHGPQRGAVIDGAGFRWPNGRVPFVVDASLQSRVDSAINHIEVRVKGVDFVTRTSEADFVNIIPDDSVCSSFVGRVGGAQALRRAPGCNFGIAVHELLHALGLFHEHTRCDRDNFVEILWDSIRAGAEHNFFIHCGDATDYFLYDEGSIMHYRSDAFGVDGAKTIRSLRGLENLMGQDDSLGPTDRSTTREIYPFRLTVEISGEQFLIGDPAEYTWTASAAGGTPPYLYTWWIDRASPYSNYERIPDTDGRSTIRMYVDRCDGNFALQVRAADSDRYSTYRGQNPFFLVENWINSPETCW